MDLFVFTLVLFFLTLFTGGFLVGFALRGCMVEKPVRLPDGKVFKTAKEFQKFALDTLDSFGKYEHKEITKEFNELTPQEAFDVGSYASRHNVLIVLRQLFSTSEQYKNNKH